MSQTTSINLIDQSNALQFILGGNALFTVRSIRTQNRFTFKVLKDQHREGFFKVYVLNGTDNIRNYKQIGFIDPFSPELQSISIHTKESPAFIAFSYLYMNLCIHLDMPLLEIWHEGRCCRCGRTLTVPESIVSGIGPECILKR